MTRQSLKLVCLLFISLSATSCFNFTSGVDGQGAVKEKTYVLNKPFHAVKATSGWDVELIQGETPHIVVRTEENLIPLFQYKIENGELRIWNKKNIGKSKSRVVKIYYKNLTQLSASSGSELFSTDTFVQENFNLHASSGADMNIHLKTKNCEVSASSGSEIELDGTSVHFTAHASSGADINAEKLKTKTASITASSGASIDVYVLKSLTAKTSSGGDIEYRGHPQNININQSISGGAIESQPQ